MYLMPVYEGANYTRQQLPDPYYGGDRETHRQAPRYHFSTGRHILPHRGSSRDDVAVAGIYLEVEGITGRQNGSDLG